MEDIEKLIRNHVDSGSVEALKLPYIPMDTYSDIFERLGNSRDYIDTNGWQVDFWWTVDLNGAVYMFAGSWFYGNYTLTKRN